MELRPPRFFFALLASVGVTAWGTNNAVADAPVAIKLDPQHPGAAIAPDFSGLSFEISQLLPDRNGTYYFRPDNLPLIRLFHTLGIKNLRIGGNTSDRDVKRLPEEADLDSFFAFARAADVKIIYCLRLHNGDPQADARTAKYIMDHYAAQMDCFSIGQEPSAYPVEKTDTRLALERMGAANEKYQYPVYRTEWKRFADALIAAVPDIKFSGPGVHNNAAWAEQFMNDFGHFDHVALITEHLYPGGAGGKVPSPEIGRDRMLSAEFTAHYQKLHDGFVPQATASGLPYRLEEVNNYFNGGATNVSNTFASALWGLDFMYWWAEHGADGVNFHTGDKVAAGNSLQPSKYTAFFSTAEGYVIRPLGYGIKAFDLGSHGKLIPAEISNPDHINLSVYSVLGEDGNIFLTIINKEHGDSARAAKISVTQNAGEISQGQVISLAEPNNDIAATSNETLGGAVIQNNGNWNGEWTNLTTDKTGLPAMEIPAACAEIIRLKYSAK